jgi:hypothetical protein
MSYFSSYCAEVQDYLNACEHLLAAAHIDNRQFSEEELQMVESYSTDVAKIHTAVLHAKNPVISPRLFPSQ